VAEADEHELLAVARDAARAAADELTSRFGRTAVGVRSKTTPTDLASDADLAAEAAIRDLLARRRPGDSILGEEGGATGEGALRWLVDPLDGTVNYLFGIPMFAVSVACEDASGAIAGVVLDPTRDELFAATRSGEATLNGEAMRGSTLADRGGRARGHGAEPLELATAMVATGFGYDTAMRARQAPVISRVLPRVRDIRRFGAAALDLAWCAAGRFDAYYERGVQPWDVAAGTLICRRAGLEVRDLPTSGEDPPGLVVAPPAIVYELYELVAR
jgi:myo-inositol-1(or 4)-monophosphatase